MNNNMTMLAQMMMNGGNPRQMIENVCKQQMTNNPMGNNLYQMIQQNDMKGIEIMARNMCKERGINPEDAVKQARGMFHM